MGVFVAALLCQAAQAQTKPTFFLTTLEGAQQVPSVVSGGSGTGSVRLVDSNGDGLLDAIDINLTVTGLTGIISDAHIHQEAPGVNGQIRITLFHDENDNLQGTITEGGHGYVFNKRVFSSGTSTPLSTTIQNFQDGLPYYFNVHTSTNPGGEIRGNLIAVAAPEPGALALMGIGCSMFGIGVVRRRNG